MKKIVYILALLVVSSCASKKNIQKTSEEVTTKEESKATTQRISSFVDTTATCHGEIIITEVDFFQDTINDGTIVLQNFGTINGKVKSLRQTTMKSTNEKNGIYENVNTTTKEEKATAIKIKSKDKSVIKESTSNPFCWYYIFFVLAVIAIIFTYMNRKATWSTIKRVFYI